MKLHLTVDNRILASIPVEATGSVNDYYLKAFRRLLTIRHQKQLALLNKKPAFVLESLPINKGINLLSVN